MLPLHRKKEIRDFDELFTLPLSALDYDWRGEVCSNPPSFIFAADRANFYLGARAARPPVCDKYCLGQFAEGLWLADVAELFFREDYGERYHEFNLSPSGAWWSCVFTRYRERETPSGFCPSLETWAEQSESHWSAAIRIPKDAIAVAFDGEERSRANVSFILGRGNQQFFSWMRAREVEPDFHLIDRFEQVERIDHW